MRYQCISQAHYIQFPSLFTHTLLFLIPTCSANGFLKNPSRVSISPCLNSNSYLLNTVPTISANSISATLRPTHALGP